MTTLPVDKKVYVLDTSVLINDPHAIDRLGDNIIVVPVVALEELDKFKGGQDLLAASSREASRVMDGYRAKGALSVGVATDSSGVLIVDCNGISWDELPVGLEKKNDNAILLVAKNWQKKCLGKQKVILLTGDINLRIKAGAWGIDSEDYRNNENIKQVSELPSGQCEIVLDDRHAGLMTDLGRDKKLLIRQLDELDNVPEFHPNMCCRFVYGGKYLLAIYKYREGVFRLVPKPQTRNDSDIRPCNDEQAFAKCLLEDPEINLVALCGRAGAGKTLLSLKVGYQLTKRGDFQTMLVFRPNIELGNSLGFLPGTLEEKFAPWQKPILRNMKKIVRGDGGGDFEKDGAKFDRVDELMRNGFLDIEPINFEQGGTIDETFIIIDESQNLDHRSTKILVTRSGRNSKVVLNGDLQQICNTNNPDPTTSGLVRVVRAFIGQENFGFIVMPKSERSQLAEQAASLL